MSPAVQGTSATVTVQAAATVSLAAKAVAKASLLPEPHPGGLDSSQDAMAMLYTLMAHQQTVTMKIGDTSIKTSREEQTLQINQERKSEISQEKAEESSGFWSDLLHVCEAVAKIAGVVVTAAVGVAGACFSGGATLVAALAISAVLVSGGMVVQATHCFGDASSWIALGAEIVGAVLSMGVGLGVIGSSSASAAADAASGASSTLQTATTVVKTSASIVEGAASVAAGVAAGVNGAYTCASDDDAADVEQALAAIQHQSDLVDALVTGLKNSQQDTQNALQLVAGAAKTHGATLVIAAGGKA